MSTAAPHARRLGRLRATLGTRGPALLVTHLPKLRWLCGFTGTAGRALVTPHRALFLTDARFLQLSYRSALV